MEEEFQSVKYNLTIHYVRSKFGSCEGFFRLLSGTIKLEGLLLSDDNLRDLGGKSGVGSFVKCCCYVNPQIWQNEQQIRSALYQQIQENDLFPKRGSEDKLKVERDTGPSMNDISFRSLQNQVSNNQLATNLFHSMQIQSESFFNSTQEQTNMSLISDLNGIQMNQPQRAQNNTNTNLLSLNSNMERILSEPLVRRPENQTENYEQLMRINQQNLEEREEKPKRSSNPVDISNNNVDDNKNNQRQNQQELQSDINGMNNPVNLNSIINGRNSVDFISPNQSAIFLNINQSQQAPFHQNHPSDGLNDSISSQIQSMSFQQTPAGQNVDTAFIQNLFANGKSPTKEEAQELSLNQDKDLPLNIFKLLQKKPNEQAAELNRNRNQSVEVSNLSFNGGNSEIRPSISHENESIRNQNFENSLRQYSDEYPNFEISKHSLEQSMIRSQLYNSGQFANDPSLDLKVEEKVNYHRQANSNNNGGDQQQIQNENNPTLNIGQKSNNQEISNLNATNLNDTIIDQQGDEQKNNNNNNNNNHQRSIEQSSKSLSNEVPSLTHQYMNKKSEDQIQDSQQSNQIRIQSQESSTLLDSQLNNQNHQEENEHQIHHQPSQESSTLLDSQIQNQEGIEKVDLLHTDIQEDNRKNDTIHQDQQNKEETVGVVIAHKEEDQSNLQVRSLMSDLKVEKQKNLSHQREIKEYKQKIETLETSAVQCILENSELKKQISDLQSNTNVQETTNFNEENMVKLIDEMTCLKSQSTELKDAQIIELKKSLQEAQEQILFLKSELSQKSEIFNMLKIIQQQTSK